VVITKESTAAVAVVNSGSSSGHHDEVLDSLAFGGVGCTTATGCCFVVDSDILHQHAAYIGTATTTGHLMARQQNFIWSEIRSTPAGCSIPG
jgi:hypothetical protein